VDGIRGIEEGAEFHNRRNLSSVCGQKRTLCVRAEAERTDARGIVEREHVVEILVRLLLEDMLSHCALY
jgi:hypothetical protein